MADSDSELRKLVGTIIEGELAGVSRQLSASPSLARASFQAGATRQEPTEFFLDEIKRCVYAGDTALHIAAAAYQTEIVRALLVAGANVHARNRRGAQALHSAAVGNPTLHTWNPDAQADTIICLIESGADPNALDKLGATPLHKAVRSRCARAVRTLLEHAADPARRNTSGSTPILLAIHNTGRGGTGSVEAKSEQQEILRLLEQHGQIKPHFK